MCYSSIPNYPAERRSQPVKLTREVLIEKTGHKTHVEKTQWMIDKQLLVMHEGGIYRHESEFIGVSSRGYGEISDRANTDRYSHAEGGAIGHAGYSYAEGGTIGHAGYITTSHSGYATITGGLRNTYATIISKEEYDKIGKVGTRRWNNRF